MSGGRHLLMNGDRYGLDHELHFPAHSINPVGLVGAATRDTSTSLIHFDPNSTQVCAGIAIIPSGWFEATTIRPTLQIRAEDGIDPGSGPNNVVQFKLYYKWFNRNSVTPADYTTETRNFTLPAHIGGQPVNIGWPTAYFDAIYGVDKSVNSVFEWKLERIGGNAADTYGGDCVLIEFSIIFKCNAIGSDES